MTQKIVVAVDGAEVSAAAIEHAIQFARQRRLALTGVFIIDGNWPDYIGNDWQSAKGARQGFLDYIREEQEAQAATAEQQFTRATGAAELADASFQLLAGDPAATLQEIARDPATALLVTSKRVFQVSGRPSLKGLATNLAKQASQPLLLLP